MTTTRPLGRRFVRLGGGICAAAALAAVVTVEGDARKSPRLAVAVVSSRADMVTGGAALIEIRGVRAAHPALSATLNGANLALDVKPGPNASLFALVANLPAGKSTIAISAGGATATLDVVDYPIAGPVFSGPHEQPFICESDHFKLQGGGTLGPSLDADCSVARRIDYLYRSTAGGDLKPLGDPNAPPSDVTTTTTLLGRTVPYIVRIETGTINRAIYQIAVLHDPAHEPAPNFAAAPAGWNHRLIYTFGGGCSGGWYRQAATTGGVVDDVMLRQGYAVASATLNVFGNNCNDVLAAETMMMVKSRFIEAYGVPLFTIGWGCSGGSYQVHQIADNYPGLLDGIVAGCSFPDVAFGTIPFITDARLLDHYFTSRARVPFSEEQQRAIAGFLKAGNIKTVTKQAGRIAPTEFCPDVLPLSLRYDARTNPTGTRCDVYDHTVNVYGRDPTTGFARRPLDNVGIQYGLGALNAGAITIEQFLDVNERIGGYDVDGGFATARTVADPIAVRAAYRTGRLTNGGGGLARTPIIDYRNYTDDRPEGDLHLRYHSFSMRERLIKANGDADNQVMLVEDNRHGFFSTTSPVVQEALDDMERWLTRIAADTTGAPLEIKVRRDRPADVTDACWTRDATPLKIVEKQERTTGRCAALYPAPPAPREVAGASVAADVIKCQLKPIDAADYKVTFSPTDLARLKNIFPDGVCDWTKPGVDQQKLAGTWQGFGPMRASGATE